MQFKYKLFIGLFSLLISSGVWASGAFWCYPQPNDPLSGPGGPMCPICSEAWKEYKSGSDGCSLLTVTVANNSSHTWVYDESNSSLTHELDGDDNSSGGDSCIVTAQEDYATVAVGEAVKVQIYYNRESHPLEADLAYKVQDANNFETTYHAVQDKEGKDNQMSYSHYVEVSGDVTEGEQYAQALSASRAKCGCTTGCSSHNGKLGYQLLDPPVQTVAVTVDYASEMQARTAAKEGYSLIESDYIEGLDQITGKPIDINPADSLVISTFKRICDDPSCYYQPVVTHS